MVAYSGMWSVHSNIGEKFTVTVWVIEHCGLAVLWGFTSHLACFETPFPICERPAAGKRASIGTGTIHSPFLLFPFESSYEGGFSSKTIIVLKSEIKKSNILASIETLNIT